MNIGISENQAAVTKTSSSEASVDADFERRGRVDCAAWKFVQV